MLYLSYVGDLKQHEEKFISEDVESSFIYMLDRLEELWSDVDISKFKNACQRDTRLSHELRSKVESASTLGKILNMLSNTHFCTWLEIRFLKSMANVAKIPEATEMIKVFENHVYSRKCSEVLQHFRKRFINPDYLTEVIAKLNKHAKCLIVSELIKYCQKLEIALELPLGAIMFASSDIGCLEIHLVIPKYCHLHAYEVVKSHFLKLRPYNIRYLEIENFSKIYTTNLTKTAQAEALLAEITSYKDICKFNNMYVCSYFELFI